MNKLLLTDGELDLLNDILNEYDYSEENVSLFHKLEHKVYKSHDLIYQNKLTTIGGN